MTRTCSSHCNGGYVGGALWFEGAAAGGAAADAGVHHVGGLREEIRFSLVYNRTCYEGRIPESLLWIMDDPFGNAICLGLSGRSRGKIYFWDHEMEPDAQQWNGEVNIAVNIRQITNSFSGFVAGLDILA